MDLPFAQRSPLWMVTRSPEVNELVCALETARDHVATGPADTLELQFSRARLSAVRETFRASIRQGEAKLHRLADLLCRSLTDGDVQLSSVVVGEQAGERFTLIQPLTADVLYNETDFELGTRLLQRVRMPDGDAWKTPDLVANFVEYQPLVENERRVHKLISRIKAEEEIWNKVADELFRLDELVARDKQLRRMSRYVKDVFGVKIVAGSDEAARSIQRELAALRWDAVQLVELSVTPADNTRRLHVVEVKDYLNDPKKSGWAAIKTVVNWWDVTFEIQVQPLPNYLREREWLTRESHAAHRTRREAVREKVAETDATYAFVRQLLAWLFEVEPGPPPAVGGVVVELVD